MSRQGSKLGIYVGITILTLGVALGLSPALALVLVAGLAVGVAATLYAYFIVGVRDPAELATWFVAGFDLGTVIGPIAFKGILWVGRALRNAVRTGSEAIQRMALRGWLSRHPNFMADVDVVPQGVPTKRVPNPWGTKGGPRHQALAEEIARDVDTRGLDVIREYPITSYAGRIARRVDVAGLRNGVPVEFHQVGLVTRAGSPVAREWDAFLDIYDLTGIWPEFHPYGVLG